MLILATVLVFDENNVLILVVVLFQLSQMDIILNVLRQVQTSTQVSCSSNNC